MRTSRPRLIVNITSISCRYAAHKDFQWCPCIVYSRAVLVILMSLRTTKFSRMFIDVDDHTVNTLCKKCKKWKRYTMREMCLFNECEICVTKNARENFVELMQNMHGGVFDIRISPYMSIKNCRAICRKCSYKTMISPRVVYDDLICGKCKTISQPVLTNIDLSLPDPDLSDIPAASGEILPYDEVEAMSRLSVDDVETMEEGNVA